MAYSANQSVLHVLRGGTPTKLENLMEIPELGSTPEKIDVTTLADRTKRYIPGIREYGDLVFKFLYDNTNEEANYRILKDMDDNGESAAFRIEYPDGTSHQFEAIPAVKIDAGTVNVALTFSATMMLQSDVSTRNP